jgi:tetratricopeptide (TPR) repeat protein
MSSPRPPVARRILVAIAALTAITILFFALVSRLVARFQANEKAIARHVFAHGLAFYQAGDVAHALDDFRTALTYDPDNTQYQLNLARALRDTGKLPEAAAYLTTLWTRDPQDAVINLALARLAVRQSSPDDALRYYHNAIYGAWTSDPDANRRTARLELINFLTQHKAFPLAQSEILGLIQSGPAETQNLLHAAQLFAHIDDPSNALSTYQRILQLDSKNVAALAGAAQAASLLGRYRTAQQYLQKALAENPSDSNTRQALETTSLVLAADPFLRRISDVERNRRLLVAFNAAGQRLQACAQTTSIDLSAPSQQLNDLPAVEARWMVLKPKLRQLRAATETDLPDTIMDLVFLIEQQTAQQCGQPSGLDLAYLLIARDRNAVDR